MATVLTLNGGSSSIRFAVYELGAALQRRLAGKIDRIGLATPTFTTTTRASAATDGAAADGAAPISRQIEAPDHRAAAEFLLDWLESAGVFAVLAGVGHRVVNGLAHGAPERVESALLAELRRITPFDPEHLPAEIALIEAVAARRPDVPQVACFDTAFHHDMPRVAQLLPVPRRFTAGPVRRYGFHGLSYAYLLQELARRGDAAAGKGRLILAHLGNGASLCAVQDGRSIDTSMGFTPSSGLVMSTRSGDLDPGLAFHLMRTQNLSPQQFQTLTSHASGLIGLSETSSDVRDLLAAEAADPRAAEALALFCYQAKKWLGAYAAALGGLDALVFAGGIGENSAPIRARICAGLEFLGLVLDARRNAAGADSIGADAGRVRVHVIRTDEEWMIATSVARILGLSPPAET